MAELFKFNSPDGITVTNSGEMINGALRTLWVERYAEPGEFEIVAPASSDLRRFLPLGTLISHTRTSEVMMVENQEITQDKDTDSELKITGRSFYAFLENRLVGVNLARASDLVAPYELTSSIKSWEQVRDVISDHIESPTSANDEIPNVTVDVDSDVIAMTATSEERTIERGDILKVVIELLDVDELGIKSVRSGGGINLTIYKGDDRKKSVIFSWTSNDLESANYLFTNRKIKNTAMVCGKFLWAMVDTIGKNNYERRMMLVDGSDIDGHLDAVPAAGPTRAGLIARMEGRGRQKLRKQRNLKITDAVVSNLTNFKYREHYFLGDLVTIEGDYNQQETKRVVEYAEIMDENGHTEHPTLGAPFDEEE